jgi:hypothetical protein
MTEKYEGPRFKLVLPEYRRLVKVEDFSVLGCKIYVTHHGITEIMECALPANMIDWRPGDMLTYYTELAARRPPNV